MNNEYNVDGNNRLHRPDGKWASTEERENFDKGAKDGFTKGYTDGMLSGFRALFGANKNRGSSGTR